MYIMSLQERLLLNDIIYCVFSIDDLDEMRRSTARMVVDLVPSDVLTSYLGDATGEHLLNRPIGINMPEEDLNLFCTSVVHQSYLKWAYEFPSSRTYRHSDLFKPGERETLLYFQEHFLPRKLYFGLTMVLCTSQRHLGSISLFRHRESGDFSDRDMHIFFQFYELRLRREYEGREDAPAPGERLLQLRAEYALTNREMEILRGLLASGDKRALSEQLHISSSTLNKHICNLYGKMNVHSRVELMKLV